MKIENEHSSKSTQSLTKIIERKDSHKSDFHSELRNWIECVILQTEKNKDFKKKSQFSRLLKDLKTSET